MTAVCVLAPLGIRADAVALLEQAGLTIAGEGRTVADGVRLARRCAALVVLGDPDLVTALAPQVRTPLVALVTAAHPDPPDGAALLSPWPTTEDALRDLVAQIAVVADRSIPLRPAFAGTAATSSPTPPPDRPTSAAATRPGIVVIGASAGGPPALVGLLRQLRPLPVPLVIVQHQHPSFADSLRTWLDTAAAVRVVLAEDGMTLLPRTVVLARPGHDLVIGADRRCRLRPAGGAPTIDVSMQSVADTYGPAALGIILTGMGRDGAEGLRAMRDRGALTIAQDRESSAVYGMPAAAVRRDAAQLVLPLSQMAAAIHDAVTREGRP